MSAIETNFIDVNGIRLHYSKSGSGSLMLFVHGFPDYGETWNQYLEHFGQTHLALAPDMRGYNLSDKPEGVEAYKARHLVADIKALAEEFSDGRFTLVGHDWGGAIAWAFAIAYPELLDRLIILNAPHPALFQRDLIGSPAQNLASQYIRLFREEKAEEIISANSFAWFWEYGFGLEALVKKGVFSQADKAAYTKVWSQPGALSAMLNWYKASPLKVPAPENVQPGFPAPSPEGLSVKVPTLVIWGDNDPALLPSQLEGLENYVPDLKVHRIAGAGHWVMREAPLETIKAMEAFLAPS